METQQDIFRTPIAEQIWDQKYRLKTFDGTPIDETVQDTWRRIAKALASVEENTTLWQMRFYSVLESFKFIPAGRINAGAGTDRNVTLFNCFVMGTIPDSMDGIFTMLKEAALTMQQGGGIGYDFSTIRPKGTEVKGVSADASGPLTFMDVWDAMCKTVMSAGSRRGAMMATMRCDHPDIEEFVEAKRDPKRLRHFNMSVLVTDEFMAAVKSGESFELKFGGKVYRTINARSLWDKIMLSTYHYAEPGVIFIDRINQKNNLNWVETIASTNPCVSGDTPILTDQGYIKASTLATWPSTKVWNGFEFSEVEVKVTGTDQEMNLINFSDGSFLDCTLMHNFILSNGDTKKAFQLQPGDKLIKAKWPVIDRVGSYHDPLAYEKGFFSGDGWWKGNKAYIGLYGDKKKLVDKFENYKTYNEYSVAGGYEGTDTTETKYYLYYGVQPEFNKKFVPNCRDYSLETRKKWLEGLMDSDGHLTKDGSAQICSKDREFLMDVKFMLNTMGATGTVSKMKDCWRLSIPASLYCKLQIDSRHGWKTPARDAQRFVTVESVERSNIASFVYCFTEPKRHLGVFNGVLTGQCGEQPLPPYGACLLGSINLCALLDDDFRVDEEKLQETVAIAVRMMDNVVDVSKFPLEQQEKEAKAKRRIGLGVTGLGSTLALAGLTYGSPEAVRFTRKIMKMVAVAAYQASIDLAKEKGPAPIFGDWEPHNKEDINCPPTEWNPLAYIDDYLATENIQSMSIEIQRGIEEHGIRNSLLTSIAPTGTISLYAGNVSSGIEPIFALEYDRKVLQKDGSKRTETVRDYSVTKWKTLNGDAPLPDSFVTAQTLTPSDHVRMQAAAQRWVDSSISKTVNVPEDIPFDDFKAVYMEAWKSGCKGCTTYRPNEVTGSVLEVKNEEKVEETGGACEIKYDENTGQLIRSCE